VTPRASSDFVHEVRLAHDRTRELVRAQLDELPVSAMSDALLQGMGTGGRPYLPFDFWNSGVESPSDGELEMVAKSIHVGEHDGFVNLNVSVRVTLTSVQAGVIHEFDQTARSRGGLDLRTAAHGIWLASAAPLVGTPPLPTFRNLADEVLRLASFIAGQAMSRLVDDIN
jgi:hypothetical protein